MSEETLKEKCKRLEGEIAVRKAERVTWRETYLVELKEENAYLGAIVKGLLKLIAKGES